MNSRIGLSIDVDSVAAHLRGYGVSDNTDVASAYEYAVPRLLELLAETGLTMTFFLIADEARRFPQRVREIISAGNEVACHSMTHPLPFTLSDQEIRRREVDEAKKVLEAITGTCVEGFRAPGFDASPELFESLLSAGYRYDASLFPSWMLKVVRRQIERRSIFGQKAGGGGTAVQERFRMTLHRKLEIPPPLFEIPIATLPVLGVPFYHTMLYLLPFSLFRCVGHGALLRKIPTSYLFHAADLLDLTSDRLDPRFVRHPGMGLPLPRKLERLRKVLLWLKHFGEPVPLRTFVREPVLGDSVDVAGAIE